MKFLTTLFITITFHVCLFGQSDQSGSHFFLIRHAEKQTTDDGNPHLSQEGILRAQNWALVFKEENIASVYSTDFFRTLETAIPIADQFDVDIILYNPFELDVNTLVEKHKGENIVIVGHSNTTPTLTNSLLGSKKYEQLDDAQYGCLFVVSILDTLKSSTQLIINP